MTGGPSGPAEGKHWARDAAWLTLERANAVALVWLAFVAILVLSAPWTAPGLRLASDFAPPWAAARLVTAGDGAAAYGDAARRMVADMLGPGSYWPCAYPPTGVLLWWPFGQLPFAAAAGAWLGFSSLLYGLGLRAIAGGAGMVIALAFPAAVIAALYGQNSLLSAALFAGAAMLIDRRPWWAGALLGLLVFKPQLGILIPVALVAAGRWRAVGGAAASGCALIGLATVVFGLDSWSAYLPVLKEIHALNIAGVAGNDRFASVFSGARLLGATEGVAWAAQAAAGLAAASTLVLAVRRRPGGPGEVAALVAATGLCVPFLGEYDIAILAVAGFWVASEAGRSGWLPYERLAIAVLFWSPAAITVLSLKGVPLAPLAMAALLVTVWRRVSVRTAPPPPRSIR